MKGGKLQIEWKILDYLANNPRARDTVEGVVQWWIEDKRIKYRTAKIRDALVNLVANGFVVESKGKNSRIHYELNRKKLGEVAALLKKRSQLIQLKKHNQVW